MSLVGGGGGGGINLLNFKSIHDQSVYGNEIHTRLATSLVDVTGQFPDSRHLLLMILATIQEITGFELQLNKINRTKLT